MSTPTTLQIGAASDARIFRIIRISRNFPEFPDFPEFPEFPQGQWVEVPMRARRKTPSEAAAALIAGSR